MSRAGRAFLYPVVALALTAGTCDVTRDVTPSSSTTTTFVATTAPPAPDAPGTTVAPTVPPEAATRTEELRAIAAALNVNRLAAIEAGDLDALREIDGTDTLFDLDRLFANNGTFDFMTTPTLDNIPYEVTEVILDRDDCAVVATTIELAAVLGFEETEAQIEVIFFDEDGRPSLANILPPNAPASSWELLCDDTERTSVPAETP